MAASHSERVLGGILNKNRPRKDLLAVAVMRLQAEHFVLETHRNIFRLLVRYYDLTNEVMPKQTFSQSMTDSGVEVSKVLAYTKAYELLENLLVEEADFRWSVEELQAEQAKRLTGVAITEAMEILERGYEVDREFYSGHEDARRFLASKLHDIDRLNNKEVAPEGNIFVEKDNILADYENRKNNRGSQRGVLTGIRSIDDRVDGWQRGELILVCAYAGLGKSQVVTQTAWHAAVEQKLNVFFATSETLRPQVMRRILARHSRLPIFERPGGINAADIKKGTLSAEDEKVFHNVVEDWYYNSDYGQLNVVQIPPHSKLSYVENRLREWGREVEVGLAVDDYLPLLEAELRRANEREEFNELLRGAKAIAQGAFDGLGVPFASPWQVRRESYEAALRNGYYTKAALSDTSEADKSADQIMCLLREEDNAREMRLQFLKMRDDELPPITEVAIDFRNSYIGAHNAVPALANSSANLMEMLL